MAPAPGIGVARGGKGAIPPKFLESIVILCFGRRFSKQNSVIRLKSNILAPQIFELATPLAPGLLVLMSVALAPGPASVRFHTLIFSIVLVCLKLNGKWIKTSTQNTYQTSMNNLMRCFLPAALLPSRNQRNNNNHRFRRFREQLLAKT